MSSTPLSPLKVEQFVAYLRVFGLLAGVPLVLLSDFPGRASLTLAWATLGTLAVATAAMWWWTRSPGWHQAWLAPVGFTVDSVLIAGFVLSWAHLEPNVSWAVVFTLLADASLRFGVAGALLGYLMSVALFLGQVQLHEALTDQRTPPIGYLYVLSTLFGIAGVLATYSHILTRQTNEVRDQALMLADALRFKERLIATSSHEVRGSLTAIWLGTETVRTKLDRLGPDRARGVLDDVLRQTRLLQRLVEDQLLVAQTDNATIGIQPRVDDIAATVDLGLSAASRHRGAHQVDVAVDSLICELDHDRLQQVVRNLAENAFKYTAESGRVSVTSTHTAGRLELRVADTGPGIAAADRERIFEPFRRHAAATAAPGEGLGIGLYLVKQIVDAMGGSLTLRTSGAGSEFVVRVPALAAVSRPQIEPRDEASTG